MVVYKLHQFSITATLNWLRRWLRMQWFLHKVNDGFHLIGKYLHFIKLAAVSIGYSPFKGKTNFILVDRYLLGIRKSHRAHGKFPKYNSRFVLPTVQHTVCYYVFLNLHDNDQLCLWRKLSIQPAIRLLPVSGHLLWSDQWMRDVRLTCITVATDYRSLSSTYLG